MVSQEDLENAVKEEGLERFYKPNNIASEYMAKCIYYVREVKKHFPKLTYKCYYDECTIRGNKDGSFPHLKVADFYRNNQVKIRLITIDGIKRSYDDFNTMLNNIDKDIKYMFIKKGNYTLEDLQ